MEAAVPGTGPSAVPGTSEHYEVKVRQSARALGGIVMGTPYCGRCRVAWPCPPAAAEQGRLLADSATEPARASLVAAPGTRCRECGAPWPCPTVSRRGGMPLARGGDVHQPEAVS
jgi:hypothetical protein